jgi:hypothetical protein
MQIRLTNVCQAVMQHTYISSATDNERSTGGAEYQSIVDEEAPFGAE